MNEAIDKAGGFPNVAVEAGRDPEEVMREYGVEPRGLRTAAYEYERTIEQLRAQVSDLTLERDILEARLAGKPECEICDRATMLVEIEGLTAKRDELSRQLDAERSLVVKFEYDNGELRKVIDAHEMGQMYRMYMDKVRECKDLASEVERMQGVVRTQAESFKKMEVDLAAANSTCNTLRASVAGLKMTVEKQAAELDEARKAARPPKASVFDEPEPEPLRATWTEGESNG
jgi:chromosome segregation ATPase